MRLVAVPVDEVVIEELEAHRRELTGYCYRMLGAGTEAFAMSAAVRGEISILERQIVEVKQEFGVSAFEPMLAGDTEATQRHFARAAGI